MIDIKHHVYISVNMAYNNKMFSDHTMAFMMKDSMKRLYLAAKHKAGDESQADIARRMNKSSQQIYNWEVRGVSQEGAIEAERVYGVSPRWLIDGVGNMFTDGSTVEINMADHPDLTPIQRVKFKLSAGVSGFAVEHEDGNGTPIFFRSSWFRQHGLSPDKLFAVRVSGASMEPSLWDQDLVVVNTNDSTPVDGEVFAVNYEGELVIKRMRRDAGEWWATSDNSDQRRFAPKRCTEQVFILGRVVYKQSERI